MLTEAITDWLLDDVLCVWPVFYKNIPQNQTTFPCVVIDPPFTFDNGNTARKTSSQKILSFEIVVRGVLSSTLTPVVNFLNTKFSAIADKSAQEQIGGYRCQCIQVLDIIYEDAIYSSSPNDRKIPGAKEQDYCWARLICRASYHTHS